MLLYLLSQSFRKKTITEVNQDVIDDSVDFANHTLPYIKEFLQIESLPKLSLCEYFENLNQYAAFDFENNTLWLSIHTLVRLNPKNYYSLFWGVVDAVCHELIHYKQYLRGQKFPEEYHDCKDGFIKYVSQDIEKEAFVNSSKFMKQYKKQLIIEIEKVIKSREEKEKMFVTLINNR